VFGNCEIGRGGQGRAEGDERSRLARVWPRTVPPFSMPTYEYICANCEHEFEVFQSMKDAPVSTCPACKKKKLKRKVGGGAGLIFKGTGFYITDYKKSSGGNAGGGDSKPAGSSSDKK
jgi:putative FmdB family regulatory protein